MNLKKWASAPALALVLAACAEGEREAPAANDPAPEDAPAANDPAPEDAPAPDETSPPGVEPTQALVCIIDKTESRTVYRGCGTCGAGRNRGDKQTRQCLRCGTATVCSWNAWRTVGSTCASCGS